VLCSVFEPVETVDAFGSSRVARAGVLEDGTRVVEAAEAIPLDPARLDVLAASSRGLGQWIAQYRDCPLVVTVGGTATMDAGAGLLEVLDRLPGPTRVLCDVATTLYDAPHLFGPQKGATSEQVVELEARFRRIDRLAPSPGCGVRAAGGLGAALRPGGGLVPGADAVLDLLGFDPVPYDLVVTGRERSTRPPGREGPAAVARRCAGADVRCAVFGGLVQAGRPPGTVRGTGPLSGDRIAPRGSVELGRSWARSAVRDA
jgi:glycerate kinase